MEKYKVRMKIGFLSTLVYPGKQLSLWVGIANGWKQ